MVVNKIVVGEFATNCYIISNKNQAVIIDPGSEPDKIIEFITANKLKPVGYLITHYHPDHFEALEEIVAHYKISLMESNSLFDFQIMATPGHKEDALCFYFAKANLLFSGDTLFFETIGRYDLKGGNYEALQISLSQLKQLPLTTIVYPGHGRETTIAHELKHNIWMHKNMLK